MKGNYKLLLSLVIFSAVLFIFLYIIYSIYPVKKYSSTLEEKSVYFNKDLVTSQIQTNSFFSNKTFKEARTLNIPQGYKINIYAGNMSRPRLFTFDSEDNMYITDLDAGKLYLFKDNDHDGIAETQITIDKNLSKPHNTELYKNDLYVTLDYGLVVYKNITNEGKYSEKKILINNWPTDGHSSRTVKVINDKLFISIGSSCNICEEKDQRRATIMMYDLDGTNEKIYASGLRNTVDFIYYKDEIWGVDNGRDLIGDDVPPEEVNIIQKNKNYGWPFCYGNKIPNPEYINKSNYCGTQTESAKYEMVAHSAPLGIISIPDYSIFNKSLNSSNILVSLHGSWNRSVPTGYKVIMIDTSNPVTSPIDFISGWKDEKGNVWGRPVGVSFNNYGDLFVSDDLAGVVYRISKI